MSPAALVTIVFLGDSITAGYGLAPEESYPARIEETVRVERLPWRIVNAGVSGDTTTDGLARLDWVLRSKPDFVFVELGANDGLRGVPVATMRKNLEAIFAKLRERKIPAALAGMRLPPNYGAAYVREFERAFPEVAKKAGVPLMPFILDGVAANSGLNQGDGIHPTEEGQRVVAEHVFAFVRRLLAAAPAH